MNPIKWIAITALTLGLAATPLAHGAEEEISEADASSAQFKKDMAVLKGAKVHPDSALDLAAKELEGSVPIMFSVQIKKKEPNYQVMVFNPASGKARNVEINGNSAKIESSEEVADPPLKKDDPKTALLAKSKTSLKDAVKAAQTSAKDGVLGAGQVDFQGEGCDYVIIFAQAGGLTRVSVSGEDGLVTENIGQKEYIVKAKAELKAAQLKAKEEAEKAAAEKKAAEEAMAKDGKPADAKPEEKPAEKAPEAAPAKKKAPAKKSAKDKGTK